MYVTQMGRAAPLMQNRDLCGAFVKTGSLGRDIPLGKGLTRVWDFQKKRCQVFPKGPLVLQRPDKKGGVESAPGTAPLSVAVCMFLFRALSYLNCEMCHLHFNKWYYCPLRQSREEKLEKPPSSAGMPCPALCLSREQVLWLRYFHEL